MTAQTQISTPAPLAYQRPPWPAAVAAGLAFVALALSSGAAVPLATLGLALAASYAVPARFPNEALTKWTLRIVAMGVPIFAYWIFAVKDESAFFDVRYVNSFALASAAELMLQFWRREPTGGARAPFTAFLSAMVFLIGCSTFEDSSHYLWYLAPAYFLFFTLALPGFRQRSGTTVALRYAAPPMLAALLLGSVIHAAFSCYKGDLNMIGSAALPRHLSPSMGMSAQPVLGSSFTLRDSLTRVLRIENPSADFYLRGMTFDTYSSRSWGPALDGRTFLNLPRQVLPRPSRTARFERLDDTNGLLFLPLHAAAIVPEDSQALEWAARTHGPVRTPATDTSALTYDVTEGDGGVLDAPPTADEAARDLVVPSEIDPRVSKIASGLAGTTPSAKIDAVEHFLRTNNAYSLTVSPGAGEPISNFILQRKAAHCEYFASAAVVLLRMLHVPTRYVSGYYAHESAGKNTLLVRQRDAHAWAESWVPETGWVTVDATPGGGRPDALAGLIPWYQRVWEKMQDTLAALRNWVVSASWAQKGSVFTLLVLGLLVPQVVRWRQRRRAMVPGFQYTGSDAALAQLSERFEALLTKRGIPCPETLTWTEHLASVHLKSVEMPDTDALHGFVRAYERARFGPPPPSKDIAWLDDALTTLEKTKVLEKTPT